MNIGKYKTWYGRATGYISIVSFLGVMYLVLTTNHDIINWLPLIVIVFVVFMYVDIKYIMPQEFKYGWDKSPPSGGTLRGCRGNKEAAGR